MQVGVMSGIGATTMMLLMGMGTATDGAYDGVVSLTTATSGVVQGPTALALLDKRTRDKLMDMGLTPKHERRVMGHVLEM